MADYTPTLVVKLDNQASAGADAAAASMLNAAAAADQLGATVETTRVKMTAATTSATALTNKYDESTAAANAVAVAQRNLAAGTATMAAAVAAGTKTQAQADAVTDGLTAKLRAAATAQAQLGQAAVSTAPAVASTAVVAQKATDAHNALGGATAGATREFLVLGHEALTGNYSKIPGSLIVLGERTNVLHTALSGLSGVFSSLGGPLVAIGVAAVASLGVAAYQAAAAQSQMVNLQNTLRATRDDYASLAPVILAASKAANASLGLGSSDSLAAGKEIGGSAAFSGSQSSLTGLIATAHSLAIVMGTELPDAAKVLRLALDDPAAEADKLAKESFPGFNSALLLTVKNLEDSGDRAGAFNVVLKAIQTNVGGAAEHLTPLGQALHDLNLQLVSSSSTSGSFWKDFGEGAVSATAMAVQGLGYVLAGIQGITHAITAISPTGARSGVTNPDTGITRAPAVGFMADASKQIDAIAEQQGYSAFVADLATRIASAESHGNQFGGLYGTGANGTGGQVTTSSAGALGRFQLLPSTAAEVGVDPTTAEGNTTGGLAVISRLASKYHNDPTLIAMAYNWGEGNLDKMLAGKATTVPNETIAYVAKVSGATPDKIGAYAGTPVSGSSNSSVGVVDANMAKGLADAAGTLPAQLQANAAQQTLLAGDLANTAVGTQQYTLLSAALDKAKADAYGMVTAQQALTRASELAAEPLAAQDGATRDIATIQTQYAEAARKSGQAQADSGEVATAVAIKLRELRVAHDDALGATERETAGLLAIVPLYQQGATAVNDATNTLTAETAARKTAVTNTADYNAQVAETVQALHNLAAAQADIATAKLAQGQQDQITLLQAEAAGVGSNTDALNAQLAVLKEKQRIASLPGGDINSAASQQSIANVQAIQNATAALNQQKSAMGELADFGEQAFNQIGQDITNAFTTGSTAGLSFKSVFNGVISEVIQEGLKLAVLNPIFNALFGSNKTTLSDVGGILGNLGGGSGGGLLSTLLGGGAAAGAAAAGGSADWGTLTVGGGGTAAAASSGVLGSGSGVLGSSISAGSIATGLGVIAAVASISQGKSLSATQVLGLAPTAYKAVSVLAPDLTKQATSFVVDHASDAVNSVSNGLGITSNLAGSGVSNGVSAAGATAGQTVGLAAADDVASAAAGTATSAASTLASYLPYIGTAISIVSDLAQGNYRGAGLVAGGAAIGATIGSIVPVIGTAVGAAVGAVVGGLVDTFFPAHPKNPYEAVDDNLSGGHLVAGDVVAQLDDPTSLAAGVNDWNKNFNAFLDHLNLTIVGADGRLANVGQGIKGLDQISSPDQIIARLGFASTDHTSNFGIAAGGDLGGQQFPNMDAFTGELKLIADFADRMTSMGIQLASVNTHLTSISVASVAGSDDLHTALNADLPRQQFADESALDAEITKVNQFVNGTIPALMQGLVPAASSFQTSLNDIAGQYLTAENQAAAYGLSIQRVTELQAEGASVIQAQIATELNKSGGYNDAISTIQANLYSAQGDQKDADLLNFDTSAKNQRMSLSGMLTDVYGDSVKSSQTYADAMALLEKSLGAQRLAIVQKYGDAENAAAAQAAATQAAAYQLAAGTVSTSVQNLTAYVTGLRTSALSPLSAQDQLAGATSEFAKQANLAASGDAKALAGLSGYADTALQADKAVYGSGSQYVDFFNWVTGALNNAVTLPSADTLTASALAATTETQTVTLVAALAAVQAEIAKLRAEVQQGSLIPARVS